MKKITLPILGASFLISVLSGCNTTEGIGKDLSKTGDAISNAAEQTSRKMDEPSKPPVRKKTDHRK